MATGNINLGILGKTFSRSKSYTNSFENVQEVDNTDGFINLLTVSTTKGANTVSNIKALCIHNESSVGAEIQFIYQDWKDNSNTDEANSVDLGPGSATVNRYTTMLLPAGEFMYIPNGRMVSYAEDASAANATSISNVAPNSNEYTDSTADVDTATDGAIASGTTTTTLYLEDGHSKFFKVKDLIRLENEICEVTAVGTGADLANSTLTIIRGTHGSTAATHADDVAVRFPFFNAYNNYDRYTVAQTNKDGKFKCMNFFGYGRTSDTISDGIVPGSVCFKFYTQAYQEVGLSGITANTNSGLSASTAYYFTIAVDGGSAYEVAFTTDSSNVNFGGKNGIISKIQDILDTQYYTEGNLFEKRVTVGIINGDLRFTSGSRLSTSAIALTAGTSGGSNTTNLFDGSNQIARFPAKVETAVASRLPDDTILDRVTYEERPNESVLMYDDGQGNLVGAGSGTISYETGAVDFTGPQNSEFVISATYLSAHSGGTDVSTTNGKNHITSVGARSTNGKLNAKIRVIALN
tara:strand:- start:858 stop:2423 length:1566 start_codon:yes stop_codon:yes gene_type:complete